MWGFLGELISPITDLIGKAIPDADKKIEAQSAVAQLQAKIAEKMQDYEAQLLDAKKSVIVAEAQSQSWIARNWRPITMLTFVALVVAYWFGVQPPNAGPEIMDQLFGLIKIGLGGYVVGRSVEKTASVIAPILAKKN